MSLVKIILPACMCLILLSTGLSFAEVGRKSPNFMGNLSAGPYYNPASKSYFELFKIQRGTTGDATWEGAKLLAEGRFFKNAQGRLAIVNGLDTHQFILRNFASRNFWIGLQYFCASNTIRWVDGTDASETKFSAWDIQWSNTHIRCADMDYMSVHYTTQTSTKSLRWRASGPHKKYDTYLVEYATGKE